MKAITITKKQTNFIKGLAILLIVLHNYFHLTNPSTGENEFSFNVQNAKNLFSILQDYPVEIINTLFSFFGHYGVQLFIFISGYGLTKSFMSKRVTPFQFIKKRALKIYPVFLISIIVLIAYNFILNLQTPNFYFLKIICKILMLHTLVPYQSLSLNGPWWFYGLIVQLYILFIPIFYSIKKYGAIGFVVLLLLSYTSIYLFYTPLMQRGVYIMANAPAHIPEFVLGIWLALYPQRTLEFKLLPLLLIVFILGNIYFLFFPFTFIAITYILVITIMYLYKYINHSIFIFYGKISMYLFAIHGFFRAPLFVPYANKYNDALISIIIGGGYLLTVTLLAYLFEKTYTKMEQKFTNLIVKKYK